MARLDSGYLPRGNPCAQCGKPIPRPDWVESSPAARRSSGSAAPAIIASKRSRSTKKRIRTRSRPESHALGRRSRSASADEPAIASEPSAHAAAGRAVTARRHARARWRCAIERPRPKPAASSMLRASSPRTNGSSMFCFSASEMPGPSSSTSIVSRSADTRRRIAASAPNLDGILHEIGDGCGAGRRAARSPWHERGRRRRPCVPCRRTGR